jgi:hypothetical protein
MASVVCFFVICYDSNAMTFSNYFSNFVIICVDFLCLDFGVQLVQETPRAFSAVVVHSINLSSFQCHWDVAAPRLPRLPWNFSKGAPVQVAAGCRNQQEGAGGAGAGRGSGAVRAQRGVRRAPSRATRPLAGYLWATAHPRCLTDAAPPRPTAACSARASTPNTIDGI